MANAIQNALKRKRELERELAEISRFLELYDQFSEAREVSDKSRLTVEPPPMTALVQTGQNSFASTADAANTDARVRGRPSHFADVMAEVLKETNRPMQRADIVAALEKGGIMIPSEDKERYIGTILWRFRFRFTNVPGQGYRLAEDAAEDAAAFYRIAAASGDGDDV